MDHYRLVPDPASLAIRTASSALQSARRQQTAKAGSISVPNSDGTRTVIGRAGGDGISLGASGDVTWTAGAEARSVRQVSAKADQIASELAGLEPAIAGAQQKANDALAGIANALYFSFDEWAVSESSTEPPTSGWSTTTPAWHEGVFIWQRTTNEYGDGSVTVGEPVILAGAKGATGEDAVVLRIDSSRGTAFKNNAISTVLSVTVFKGSKQITNISALREEFGPSAYLEWLWRRLDDSDFGLISAADDRLSNSGFSLTVSPADVDDQTVFQCVLHT